MQEPTIASRLQELNKWQEEQKKLLNERQNMQRKLLGLEQRNMYQMLGLLHPSDTEQGDKNTQKVTAAPASERLDVAVVQNEDRAQEDDDECTQATLTQKTSGYSTDDPSVDIAAGGGGKPKKTFLKRGEGLKQRFKIHPDELRLENLPRYKYASSHPSLTSLRSRSSTDSVKPQVAHRAKETNQTTCNAQTQPHAQLDAQEKRFQQLLLASQNMCNSTPDTKSGMSSFEASGGSHKIRFTEVSKESSPSTVSANASELSSTPGMTTDGLVPISWAKVLDTQQIKPKIVQQIRTTTTTATHTTANASHDDSHHSVLDNITLFELLEQRAKDGSFDVNSSCIRNFMQRKMHEQQMAKDTDEIPVSQQLKECGLQPKVEQVFRLSGGGGGNARDDQAHDNSTSSSSSSDNEDNESVGNNTTRQTNESHDDTATANTQTEDALPPAAKNCFRVRFTDEESLSVQAMTTTSDTSTLVADESTLNNTEMFQQFKDALFSALQSRADKVNTEVQTTASHPTAHSGHSAAVVAPSPPTDELQEKANLIKERLAELEREIATFKDNNMQLIKAKQEHELQKAQFAQERFETVERLNDEKIQMEIYLHDERMKLEDEKRKFEQKVRNFKTTQNAVERKEVLRLKQEIDELQLQMKQKEQLHVTAQARLRAKVRNLEKDQKQLLDDIELLKKENKRLENDNVRICRENDNKMLNEINRNIAKLAPKFQMPLSTCLDEGGGQKKPNTMPNVKCNNVKKADAAVRVEKSPTRSENPINGNTIKTHKTNDIGGRSGGGAGGDTSVNLNAIESMPDDYADESQQNTSANDSIVNAHVLRSAMQYPNKSTVNAAEFKREIINADGSKDIWYPNGNLKKISADAMTIRMLYFNKDIKETNIHEGTVKYYYADTNTWHTTYLDGLEILEFPNGQTEHRYKDGTVEVHFPNNTVKVTNPADEHKLEEWRFADGTNLLQLRNGDRILMFPNGQKEIHTKLNKRREYPDGTVKLVYPDGSQETRYSNGRVRLKDKDGKLIMDTETINQ